MNQSKELARKRVARYRTKNRRIDYIPSAHALKIIEQIRVDNPGWSYQITIDVLLQAAEEAIAMRR
jgi:hypothetical protein